MILTAPAVPQFLGQLAGHLAGSRAYLSGVERAALVGAVQQFEPTFGVADLDQVVSHQDPNQLRLALGRIAEAETRDAECTVVGALQLAMADGRIDALDRDLLHWVGDTLGISRHRISRLVDLVDA
ncbi:MAG: hypothetical protein ACKV2O_02225 [Acidimicrobiales bacterium]